MGDVILGGAGDDDLMPHPVVWVGRRIVRPTPGAPVPVRILRDAFADGVPSADLVVLPDLGFHLNGVLIPVRMLVNHRSIVLEERTAEFEVFHVETARHVLISANGARSETYRDCGERSLFRPAPHLHLVPKPPVTM